MAPHLTGQRNPDLWNRLVLQACESDSSIRHAVIALAALKSVFEAKHSSSAWTEEEMYEANNHHQFALKSFSRAVKAMKAATLSGKQDLRSTLTSCMVIICFETFHGESDSATRQIGIGLSLIEDHLINSQSFEPTNLSIEHDLIAAFGQLEMQSMTFGQSRAQESHRRLIKYGQSSVDSMPIEFQDFQEAHYYFDLAQQRIYHYMASVLKVKDRGCLALDATLFIPIEDVPGRDYHLTECHRWYKACEPILDKAQNSSDRGLLLNAALLQLMYYHTLAAALIARDSTQDFPDSRKLIPIYTQILTAAKDVLRYETNDGQKPKFKIAMEIIAPLYGLSRLCPHRGMRKEAISLLMSRPRREGLWDSVLSAKASEWVLLHEEENYDGDHIEERLRCTALNITECDLVARRACVNGKFPNREGTELIYRETEITW